jgi:hypothetical protein
MSKRARGTNRPGQRRPTQRAGTRPSASPTSAQPAAASAPAAVPASSFATPETSGAAPASPALPSRTRARASSTFTASAAQEYGYVVSDVRRIILIGGSLVGVILILFVLIDVLHLITI